MTARYCTFALITCIGLTLSACKEAEDATHSVGNGLDDVFDRGELVVVNDDGIEHKLDIYLALDYEQKRRGLMFVRDLADDAGMLFIYDNAAQHSMWMKNTYISLDMIFARRDGSVSSVIHDTTPLSLTSQGAIEPVNFVLELNAGAARRLGIGNNSKIQIDDLMQGRNE